MGVKGATTGTAEGFIRQYYRGELSVAVLYCPQQRWQVFVKGSIMHIGKITVLQDGAYLMHDALLQRGYGYGWHFEKESKQSCYDFIRASFAIH